MRIAITGATLMEIEMNKNIFVNKNHSITFHCHGIGMITSTYHLQKIFDTKPDMVIQCGIAGVYKSDILIGETVLVENEMIESGTEDNENQIDIFELGLLTKNNSPFINKMLPSPFVIEKKLPFKKVNGLTVDICSGNKKTIERRIKKYNPTIETMEGAALHYIGLMNKISFIQLKTISNFVEPRNKNNWQIDLALKNNNKALQHLLEIL